MNAQIFVTIGHDTVQIRTLLYKRNPYSYLHLEIFICIYSVRGEIDQISTNTTSYTTCCVANVYIFVYIFIGDPIVPLILFQRFFFFLFLLSSTPLLWHYTVIPGVVVVVADAICVVRKSVNKLYKKV